MPASLEHPKDTASPFHLPCRRPNSLPPTGAKGHWGRRVGWTQYGSAVQKAAGLASGTFPNQGMLRSGLGVVASFLENGCPDQWRASLLMQVLSWSSVNTTPCPQALKTVFQGGGVCVRCQTQPDSCNCKNQSQQLTKSAPNEVLSMFSKYCTWLPRQWRSVAKGQPGGRGVGRWGPGPPRESQL